MAIIDGLTTLANVKLEAGISDTLSDTLLEALISSCSASVSTFLDRQLKKTTRTAETYAVNNSQMLYLRHYPIQGTPVVSVVGNVQVFDTDFFMDDDDRASGRFYRPTGWTGNYWTRGTFPDIFAGARNILATYISGYLLPADVGYIAGELASLPISLTYAVNRAVIMRYRSAIAQNEGLKTLGEGGLSYGWFGPESYKAGGFDDITIGMLMPYKRREAV